MSISGEPISGAPISGSSALALILPPVFPPPPPPVIPPVLQVGPLTMPLAIQTTVSNILRVVKKRLVEVAGFEESTVKIVRRGRKLKVPLHASGRDCLVHAGGLFSDQKWMDGGGRIATLIRRRIGVTLRTRNDLDDPTTDEEKLLSAGEGHYNWEDEIANALHGIPLEDDRQGALLIEPMRLLMCSDVTDDPEDSSWTWSTLEFEAAYMEEFDLAPDFSNV